MLGKTNYNARFLCLVKQLAIIVSLVSFLGACSESSSTPASTADTDDSAVAACMTAQKSYVEENIGAADSVAGGRIYDKWWVAARGTEPQSDHPLWSTQSTNTRTLSTTWRCKECHGWDYKGKDGAYGPASSHFTNFIGVMGARDMDPVKVFCTIKSLENHNFDEVMANNSILDLTALITDSSGAGIIDYNQFLDASNMSTGDGSTGGAGDTNFQSSSIGGCGTTFCHGPEGKDNAGNEFSIGDVALDNPWEFLHKVRFGQPGTSMPAGVGALSDKQIQDILAYSQLQLPQVAPPGGGGSAIEGDVIRGGLLYDNWPSLLTAEGSTTQQPVLTMPLFGFRKDTVVNTRSGIGTWRCKECHGWDYEGVDGVYGNVESSHYTGFPGLLTARNDSNVTEQFLLNFLKNGYTDPTSGITYHKFSTYLTDADLVSLVSFIKVGVINTSPFISSFPAGAGQGDAVNGAVLYKFNRVNQAATPGCSLCHALNGAGIDFGGGLFLGALARDNPWEVLHKTRFGQPSTIGLDAADVMPSTLQMRFTNADAADIMTYSQTLQ